MKSDSLEMRVRKQRRKPQISIERGAEIFRQMLQVRRDFCADNEWFKTIDLCEYLAKDNEDFLLSEYEAASEKVTKAGVAVLDQRITLVLPDKMVAAARRGSGLANFTLAHELAHIEL